MTAVYISPCSSPRRRLTTILHAFGHILSKNGQQRHGELLITTTRDEIFIMVIKAPPDTSTLCARWEVHYSIIGGWHLRFLFSKFSQGFASDLLAI